jgi:hypothetical protein
MYVRYWFGIKWETEISPVRRYLFNASEWDFTTVKQNWTCWTNFKFDLFDLTTCYSKCLSYLSNKICIYVFIYLSFTATILYLIFTNCLKGTENTEVASVRHHVSFLKLKNVIRWNLVFWTHVKRRTEIWLRIVLMEYDTCRIKAEICWFISSSWVQLQCYTEAV